MDINRIRFRTLMIAEAVDAFRVVPRLLVAGYGYVLYKTVTWYQSLVSYIPEAVVKITESNDAVQLKELQEFLVQAPSTQHAVLVTSVIGMAAVIFAFYTNTGTRWSEYTAKRWKLEEDEVRESKNDEFSFSRGIRQPSEDGCPACGSKKQEKSVVKE